MKIIQKKTVNQSNRTDKDNNKYEPRLIVWHIAEGTYNGTVGWEKNPQSEVSSHFVLGKNGDITQLVPIDKAAWTQGVVKGPTHPYVKAHPGVNPNLYCISIECEGFWKDTKGKLTDKALKAAAELTRYIVHEVKRIYGYTIPIDRDHIIGHYEINSVTRSHCPGELFQFDELIKMANGQNVAENKPKKEDLKYTIQIGAFSNSIRARELYIKLSDMGYFCFVTGINSIDRVCVGKFTTTEEAERTLKDLDNKGYKGFITTL